MQLETSKADAPSGASPGGPANRLIGATYERTRRSVGSFAIPIVLVVLIAIFSFISHGFFSVGNFESIVTAQAIIFILTLGVLFPLRSGDFDLSVSATMIVSATIVGVLTTQHHVNVGAAILLAMGAGVGIGIVNGFLVVFLGLDAFIATLGTQTVLTGIGYLITNTTVIASIPSSLETFSRHTIAGIPLAVIYGWCFAAICWFVFEYTAFGRSLLFMGGNREAARLVGLRVTSLRMSVFLISGTTAAFAGIVLAGQLGGVDPTSGAQYLLQPYAACFLGAAAIQLGRFNVIGTVVALYLLAVGITGIELLGVSDWVAQVFNGGALVGAIAFAQIAVRTQSARRRQGQLAVRESSAT